MRNNIRLARVKIQKLGEIHGNTDAYDNWCDRFAKRGEDGEIIEPEQANPDSLPEGTSYFGDPAPTTPQIIMGEAIEHLQGRQKEVYMLMMREGYSCAEAGRKLGISKWTARDYKDRAVKFITQYCKQQAAKL